MMVIALIVGIDSGHGGHNSNGLESFSLIKLNQKRNALSKIQ